jgi:hypothetical protein
MAYDSVIPSEEAPQSSTAPYPAHALALGSVQELCGARARVRMGTTEAWLAIDPSVDPALIAQASATGARVVVEQGGAAGPCIVGALCTARALELDRKGNLEVSVKRFVLRAEEALLATPRSFLRIREQVTELFGDELIVRGRLLTRILGKAIKLN